MGRALSSKPGPAYKSGKKQYFVLDRGTEQGYQIDVLSAEYSIGNCIFSTCYH
jgi:hypothetical protein